MQSKDGRWKALVAAVKVSDLAQRVEERQRETESRTPARSVCVCVCVHDKVLRVC